MTERESLPEEPQRNEWLGILVRTLVAVLVLGGGYYFAAQYLGGRIPNGTQVEGVDIGGQSPEAARDLLEERLETMATDDVHIEIEGDTFSVDPQQAGLSLDLDSTLQGITGVSYDPRVMWGRITDDGTDLPLHVSVDSAALTSAVEGLSEEVAIEPTNGTVRFSQGEVRTTDAELGRTLDVAATAEAIEAVWPQTQTVEGVTSPAEPELGQAQIDTFVEQVAGPAVSGPITVDVDGDESTISVNQLTRLLTVTEAEDHTLGLKLDEEGLLEVVSGQLDEATVSPRNASVALENGKPVVTKARAGQVVDEEELVAGVKDALAKSGDQRRVTASTIDVKPEVTDADAKKWEFSKMATFRSEFPTGAANEARTENIRVGLRHLNGTVVAPGDTFSLADTLAPISKERGYVEAGVIDSGRLVQGMGGGLSQVSTTVLNTAWDSGLELVEFHPHSYYISRYPAGKEATIAVGILDNRWTNNTKTPVIIETHIEGDEIVMTFWGRRRYHVETITGDRVNVVQPESHTDDSPACLTQHPQEGFDITVTRVLSDSSGEIDRQSWTTHYAPSPEVVCTNPNAG